MGQGSFRAHSWGMTEEAEASQPWEMQAILRGSQACVSTSYPTPYTAPTSTLTPLQTWPPPAPRCDPGSCWQLWGARGADGHRWGTCAGKMGSTGMREQGDTQTTPFYTGLGGSRLPAPSWGGDGTNQGRGRGSPTALQGRAEVWAGGPGLAQLLTG